MNEWTFTAAVASWLNLIIDKNADLPFGHASVEEQGSKSRKRRDLTLTDRNGVIVLTGEVKLPDKRDGATPFNHVVVADARSKARAAGAQYFFTWNVNQCVLWQTDGDDVHPRPDYKNWQVVTLRKSAELASPLVQANIKKWLPLFLNDVAAVLRGAAILDKQSPDEKFIDALEAALSAPIALTTAALQERHRTKATRRDIDAWMRDELGFTLSDDSQATRLNLENAAKHAVYALANKLVFYAALLKRYGANLPPLALFDHLTQAEQARNHLEKLFADARRVTHDYETVFGENALGYGNRVPFFNDGVVDFWKAFIEEIDEFDFSRLDYEVIGNIFERLIAPEERSKFGQFYTRVEVVDLINSFAIRTGHETILDPACGGGTFLVRAYARKRELAAGQTHAQRLRDLFGIDLSRFATHLTTINLATRDLIDDENYPQVARSDFFDVRANSPFIDLPMKVQSGGLGKTQRRAVIIPKLDAIVGNPPYIRQEEIPQSKKGKKPQPGTKQFYQALAKEQGARLTMRSDIHTYFWPHSLTFLKDNGRLCFLTSSQWLDTDYGFKLQAWLLEHFEIVAILESLEEPWFVGARVVTTATILRRQTDAAQRMTNTVRFVQLRQPLRDLLAHDGTTVGAIMAADGLRDELLGLTENQRNARYRARLVQQGDLWHDGVQLSVAMGKSKPASDDFQVQTGAYYGGKWGIQLRAPDLWFKFTNELEGELVPLVEIAEVRFGVKSGKDAFFFPRDATEEALELHIDNDSFYQAFGAKRSEVVNGTIAIVKCGEKFEEMRPIEWRFLEPEVHSIMGWEKYSVEPEECDRYIVLIPSDRKAIAGTHAFQYVQWGEERNFHTSKTVSGRVTEEREWFDLTDSVRASVILPKIQQYRLFTILNENMLYQASALLGVIDSNNLSPTLLAAILNSTISILSRILHARILGNEGNIQLDVYAAEMMLVPDPRSATDAQRQVVADAFTTLKKRNALAFLSERRLRQMHYQNKGWDDRLARLSDESELTQADRRQLDDAVLAMLGINDAQERKQRLDELYAYLADFFEWTRQKEEKAIVNKQRAKRGKKVSAAELAQELLQTIDSDAPTLRRRYHDFLDLAQPYDTYELPQAGDAHARDSLLERDAIVFLNKGELVKTVETRSAAQRNLLLLLAQTGMREMVSVPFEATAAAALQIEYATFLEEREATVRVMVEEKSADPDLQEKLFTRVLKELA